MITKLGKTIRCHTSDGQSLVEVVISLAVVVVLVTGLISATTTSLRSVQQGRSRSKAVLYAQEALEKVRELRNQSWSTIQSRSGVWCLDDTFDWTGPVASCSPNIDGVFIRSVTFTYNGASSRMEVTATVSWRETNEFKDVSVSTYLTDWN